MLLKLLSNNILKWLIKRNIKKLKPTSTTWGNSNQFGVFFLSRALTPSACCARCTSATKIFQVEPVVGRFVKMFPHCSDIHFFIINSSHQAFGWNATCTLRSEASCSLRVILRSFPRNITSGWTRGTPLANIVSCTLHCRLSRPEDAWL